jgi:hypothetical protein
LSKKYRGDNDPPNTTCDVCQKPTWAQMGVFTMYHGKANYWNNRFKKEPISYFHKDLGIICKRCWDESDEDQPA